ncbi:MAG: hypothetical protein QOD92_449 [Acidimicrobiaceae bacterium]|jgi:hypothetical protein
MDDVVEALVEENPFLLATVPTDDNDDEDDDDGKDPFRARRSAVNSFGSKRQSANRGRSTRAQLANKYPALRYR